jgi:hypothetical protein
MSSKICLVAALALAAVPCFGSTIFVTNFSFETLPVGGLTFGSCGAGCAYSEASGIPGWLVTSGAQIGQFQPGNPGNTNYFSALSDGITSAYSNIDGSVISQTVGETVVLGEVYTLLIDIGWRFDLPFTGTADLLINGHTYNATGTTPTRGTFGVFTASYTGTSADVGHSITIELRSSGGQANFDNVRLDGSVPEPASFLLIAPALLALGLRIKRTARP